MTAYNRNRIIEENFMLLEQEQPQESYKGLALLCFGSSLCFLYERNTKHELRGLSLDKVNDRT